MVDEPFPSAARMIVNLLASSSVYAACWCPVRISREVLPESCQVEIEKNRAGIIFLQTVVKTIFRTPMCATSNFAIDLRVSGETLCGPPIGARQTPRGTRSAREARRRTTHRLRLLWWTLPDGVIAAAGARGQWIFAVPGRSLAVAVTSENPGEYFGAPVQFLYSHILPAISR